MQFFQKEFDILFLDFKDDLNATFAKGYLELSNIRLNTDVLQDTISSFAPYLKVESAIAEKIRIKVPFKDIKTKPLEVSITRLDVVIKEPVEHHQVQALLKGVVTGFCKRERTPKSGKITYTLFDRIVDGIQLKVELVKVTCALLGTFKHAKSGPWTPHVLEITASDVDVYSTDENWEKGDLKKARTYTHEKPHVWNFKEGTCRLSIKFIPPNDAGNSIPMDPVVIFDKLPIKVRYSQQRFSIDEVLSVETSIFIDEAKINITPAQMAHLALWIGAFSSAAFRRDKAQLLADEKDDEAKKELLKIADQVKTNPSQNSIVSVHINKLSVDMQIPQKKSDDFSPTNNLRLEFSELQLNRVILGNAFGETFTRILVSQIILRDCKNNNPLVQLYFNDPQQENQQDLLIPVPAAVLIHPTGTRPIPTPLRFCMTLVVRYPEPEPPSPSFEYTFRMNCVQVVMEREPIERLGIFMFRAGLVNANRPKPTANSYSEIPKESPSIPKKGTVGNVDDDETGVVTESVSEKGVQFLELDLLANPKALIGLDVKITEFRLRITTPGRPEKPCIELKIENVTLFGNPSIPPAVYQKDFLNLKSKHGTPLVLEHDFYYQKFKEEHSSQKEYTFKFNIQTSSIAVNMYDSTTASEAQLICAIKDIRAFIKLYSLARYIPNRETIPQVEASLYAGEVVARFSEKQYHQAVNLLAEHFVYSASSPMKLILEEEVKNLALSEKRTHRLADEDPVKRKRFLLLPTYMISAAVDKVHVILQDVTPKDVLVIEINKSESIIEKHQDRQVIIGRIQDLIISSLPEKENAIIWLDKKDQQNAVQLRTEWRKLNEGNVTTDTGISKNPSYFLGSMSGLRLNLDIRNVYNMKDYLIHVLAETYVLAERTRDSKFIWKVLKYLEILYVTGLPAEANMYWRDMREIKLLLEQFTDIFFDINYDIEFNDVRVSYGDATTKVDSFVMDKLDILTVREGLLSKVIMNAKGIKSLLTELSGSERKETLFSTPIDTLFEYSREKNPNWNATQQASQEPEWFQNIKITTSTPAKVILSADHFRTIDKLAQRHLPKLRSILGELMANADTEASKEGRAATVVVDEDVVEQARGFKARAMSPAEISLLQKQVEIAKKDLKQAIDVQNDLGAKTAQIQIDNHDVAKKCDDMEKKVKGYEVALAEMRLRLAELEKKAAEKVKPQQ